MSDRTAETYGDRRLLGSLSLPRSVAGADLGGWLGTAVLPFALVLYLGLKGGGYDAIVRSEVGIAVWWIVLVGAVAGLLPIKRLPRWSALSLLGLLLFAFWTAVGIGWSSSAERSVVEVARVAALLGVFAGACALQQFGGLRRTVGGAAAAIALIGLLALGSRLHPSWFPANETAEFLASAQNRLNWPLNYWNGLATLVVMGIPLLLALATAARSILVRSLSAALVPALALTAFFTLSRGGALELGVALIVLVALSASRLGSLPTWSIAAGGGALLVVAANQRGALTDGLTNPAALNQGDEMLLLTVVTCTAVALLVASLNLAHRSGLTPSVSVPPKASWGILAAAAATALVLFFALHGPSTLQDGFEQFKDPTLTGSDVSRFTSVNGNNRWQLWSSAVDANATSPLHGIGPGTFEFWWAANGTGGFVRDAHSLYAETLGELGIVGLVLLLGLLLTISVGSISRLRAAMPGDRKLLAGSIAAMLAFLVAAGIDWAWELTVLPVVFFLLAAAALGGRVRPIGDRSPSPRSLSPPARGLVGALAIVAIGAIVVPLASTQELRGSQRAAASSNLAQALTRARGAGDLQPFAASPPLQRALVLERDGGLRAARAAALEATRAEATNWRTWFVLARIEAERKNAPAALAAFKRAKELNPKSPILGGSS